MAIVCDLAMTAAEFHSFGPQVLHPAWMACHFSPYGLGLSNCPEQLPKGATLILNDRTPAHGHDPGIIVRQLCELKERLQYGRILLDFQRPDCRENAAIAKAISNGLACPVGVSELYAAEASCPVFLTPPPLHVPLPDYLTPWSGREIWLEAALDGEIVTVTDSGAAFAPLPSGTAPAGDHCDKALCCHYSITLRQNQIRFTLHRTREDLSRLLQTAENLGITRAIGLYQELG